MIFRKPEEWYATSKMEYEKETCFLLPHEVSGTLMVWQKKNQPWW